MAKRMQWIKLFQRGDHPLLVVDIFVRAQRDRFAEYFRMPVRMRYYLRHSGETYFAVSELEVVRRTIRTRLDTGWPLAILRKNEGDLRRLVQYARQLDPQTARRQQLHHFFYRLQPAWLSVYFPLLVGDEIEEELVRQTAGLASRRREKMLRLAATPAALTQQLRYSAALQQLARLRGSQFSQAALRVVQQFRWIKGYLMNVQPLTLVDIERDMRLLGSGGRQRTAAVVVPRKLQRLVRLSRRYVWFRDWRLSAWNETLYFMKPVLEAYVRDVGLTYPELCQLTIPELLSKRFRRQAIRERQRGYGIVMREGRITIATGKGLARLRRESWSSVEPQPFVRGTVAVVGKAMGRVRIVFPYQFHRVQPGDIVVTSETTPDAAPYLRRVKAIVTDEGGLTSHAAIIAREFHIPCIIGKKIATRVFKDGDGVEVDAERGVVRKLNRQ